jgi:hypothetical protein
MDKHDFLRIKIKQHLKKIREKNPRLSERYFASVLGIAPSTFSEFMMGKRQLSEAMCERVLERLQISPEEKSHFKELALKKQQRLGEFVSEIAFLQHVREHKVGNELYRYSALIGKNALEEDLNIKLWVSSKCKDELKLKIEKFKEQIIRLVEDQDLSSERKIYKLSISLAP